MLRITWLCLSLLVTLNCTAQDETAFKSITLVAGLAKPPFILEEQGTGIQLDLIRHALNEQQINAEFMHVPFGRNVTSFQRHNADGVITLPADYDHPTLHLSKPYVSYQNVAVSLVENNYTIKQVEDLYDKSIIAFQNAKKFLGDAYAKSADYSMDYREFSDQSKQVESLFMRRTEVIVLDLNIFKYFVKHNQGKFFVKPFKVHYLFSERSYCAAFKSEAIRNRFDQSISQMRIDGSYQLILDKYLSL